MIAFRFEPNCLCERDMRTTQAIGRLITRGRLTNFVFTIQSLLIGPDWRSALPGRVFSEYLRSGMAL